MAFISKLGGIIAAVAVTLSFQAAHAQEISTWDLIQETQTVRVGCINAEPWGFKDPSSGEWSGIGPGFGELVAAELQVKMECVETTWGNAVAGLQANQYDLVAGLDATPQRALAIDFAAGALVYYAVAVLARKDLEADTWDALNSPDVEVVVPLGTSNDRALSKVLTEANFTRTASSPEAIATFASGRADVVGGSSMWLMMQNHALGDQGKVIIPKPVAAATAGVGIRKEADKQWRDWLGISLDYFYWRGSMVKVYEDFLTSRGIDPAAAPGIRLVDIQ